MKRYTCSLYKQLSSTGLILFKIKGNQNTSLISPQHVNHKYQPYKVAVVAVIIWQLDLPLHMQSVPITTDVVSLNLDQGEAQLIHHYVIKFVSDLRQVGDFLHRHLKSGPPFFLIWSLPRLWYGSLSGSIYLNHLSICYNISCYNSLVLITLVFRSSCRITYIYIKV